MLLPLAYLNSLFMRRVSITFFFPLAALLLGCNPDYSDWVPDVVLTVKPDSGLTTQKFQLMVDVPNLPTSQDERSEEQRLNSSHIQKSRMPSSA